LQRLKSGGMSFEQFLLQAKEWASLPLDKLTDRPVSQADLR
jgi:hypothetical protein